MGSTFNPNQNYSASGSTTPAATTMPGTTTSSAQQGSTTQSPTLNAQQIAQFEAAYGINSTDLPAYVNGNQLTEFGQTLQWYGSLTQDERQQAQTTLVALGYLPETDATGDASATALDALKSVLTTGHLSDFQTALSNPTTSTQAQISTNLAAASKEADAANTTPVVANLTDTNAANQTLSKAFQDALGYQPSADEMNTFVQSLHAAQESEASGTKEAEIQAASGAETQAKTEESALQNLGENGLDAFLGAYANAIHGTGAAGGGTTQGPVMGPPLAPAGAQEGPYLPGQNPNTPISPTQLPNGRGAINQQLATENPNGTVNPAPGSQLAKTLGGSYGGIYALSPALWQQAQQALGTSTALGKQAAKATTAGAASKTVQQAAAGALAQHLFDTNGGSWHDVAITLAGGNPQNPSDGHVLNTSTNVQNFATGVANNVNSQIEAIQNQVNNQQAPVVGKESPNPEADALAAAESADPNQYIAHNMSLVEGTVQKMLYGTPQIESLGTSNLAGDVAQVTASNSAAT